MRKYWLRAYQVDRKFRGISKETSAEKKLMNQDFGEILTEALEKVRVHGISKNQK